MAGETKVFDSVPYAEDYTLIIVYKALADSEAMLWRLDYGDGSTRGLTTERMLMDSTSVRYASQTEGTPAISTLRQSVSSLTSGDSLGSHVRLTLGGDGAVKIAEVLYYEGRMGTAALRKVQSALALRYGITLGPVDYLDGSGRHVWHYADSGLYHHRVTGLGRDTLTGLFQRRSRSEVDGAVLTLAADSLSEGMFLVAGDNGAPSAFVDEDGLEVLQRRWRFEATSTEGRPIALTFDTRGFATAGDSLVLLLDSVVLVPESPAGDSVVFPYVTFVDDTVHHAALVRSGLLWRQAMLQQRLAQGLPHDEGTFAASLYPNPTRGRYILEVSGAEHVEVTVHDVLGRVVARHSGNGSDFYSFDGELPADNVYFATVTTEKGSQTIKLVVK